MARQYVQQLRAENAQDTRRRILDAVATRLREAPTQPISLDKVAAQARVARSTIYLVFGSRAGLFEAFAEDLGDRTGVAALRAANEAPDPRNKLRGALAAGNLMYERDRAIYRVLFSMRQLDPESIGGAMQLNERNRAEGVAWLAGLLGAAGHLRPGLSVDDAARILFVLTGFEAFDALYTDRGLPVEAVTALILAMAERSVLRENGG
ncbi:MAG TPA: TetR/AcrR family transcriptional regulator [Nakamurella sp.]